jgi:hypothetical protein
MKRSPAQPCTCLNLDEDEPRRNQRVGDVGREVDLESIHPEKQPEHPAEQQVKSVHWETTDEHSEPYGCGVAAGARMLGANAVERASNATAMDGSASS